MLEAPLLARRTSTYDSLGARFCLVAHPFLSERRASLSFIFLVIASHVLVARQSYLITMPSIKNGFVYIMTHADNAVLYTGVTSDLLYRVAQHKNKLFPGFTTRYHLTKLAYYECFDTIADAIAREKQIKAGSRKKKLDLIRSINPCFEDIYYRL